MKDVQYLIAEMIEAVRYAELERTNCEGCESGEMLHAVWLLTNPLGFDSRSDRISTLVRKSDGEFLRFTAHSHDNEPLNESYNDVLIYRTMRSDGTKSAHYIIDRFCPKKVKLG